MYLLYGSAQITQGVPGEPTDHAIGGLDRSTEQSEECLECLRIVPPQEQGHMLRRLLPHQLQADVRGVREVLGINALDELEVPFGKIPLPDTVRRLVHSEPAEVYGLLCAALIASSPSVGVIAKFIVCIRYLDSFRTTSHSRKRNKLIHTEEPK